MGASVIREEVVGASLDVAARTIGISIERLVGWVKQGLISTEFQRTVGGNQRRVWAFGFEALVFGRIIRSLEVDHSISIRQISTIVHVMREWTLGIENMSELRWAVAGPEVFVEHPDGSWHGGRRPDQSVAIEVLNVSEVRADTLHRLERPEDLAGQVERRRGVRESREVFAGTGITVETVVEYLGAGCPVERILSAFPSLYEGDVDVARRRLLSNA